MHEKRFADQVLALEGTYKDPHPPPAISFSSFVFWILYLEGFLGVYLSFLRILVNR